MSALVTFVRDELARRGWSQTDLERESGIPDSTLSRFLNNQIAEPKLSLIAQLARAFNMPFWRLVQIAGFTTETPGDPTAEAVRLATLIENQPWLKSLLKDAANLTPEDREVVQEYMIMLNRRHQRRKKPQFSEGDRSNTEDSP